MTTRCYGASGRRSPQPLSRRRSSAGQVRGSRATIPPLASIYRSLKLDDCLVAKGVYTGLAETYLALKRPRDAERLLSPAIDACREKFGERSSERSELLNADAVVLENGGKTEEAATAALEADRSGISDARFQQEDRDLLRSRLLASQGRFDESVARCSADPGRSACPRTVRAGPGCRPLRYR
jgi:hypothetical protein